MLHSVLVTSLPSYNDYPDYRAEGYYDSFTTPGCIKRNLPASIVKVGYKAGEVAMVTTVYEDSASMPHCK